jgi:hypothetical protein
MDDILTIVVVLFGVAALFVPLPQKDANRHKGPREKSWEEIGIFLLCIFGIILGCIGIWVKPLLLVGLALNEIAYIAYALVRQRNTPL